MSTYVSEWAIGMFHTSNSWRKCLREQKASTRLVCVCVCVCVCECVFVLCVCVCVVCVCVCVSEWVSGSVGQWVSE